jgi:hypothetical protein
MVEEAGRHRRRGLVLLEARYRPLITLQAFQPHLKLSKIHGERYSSIA